MDVYHGTFTCGISKFRPGSHFGSRRQALVCMAAHRFLDDWEAGEPCLYRCTLKVLSNELVQLPFDWGTPNAAGALRAYLISLYGDYGGSQKFAKHFSANSELALAEYQTASLERLQVEMAKAGHVAIEYPNAVEGDDPSWMVIDPSRVSIDEKVVLDWAEVVGAFRQSTAKNFGLSEQALTCAHAAAEKFLRELGDKP